MHVLFWDASGLKLGQRPNPGALGNLEFYNRYVFNASENQKSVAATRYIQTWATRLVRRQPIEFSAPTTAHYKCVRV